MSRSYSSQERLQIAAEKLRRKAEAEKLADDEFYKKITTGTPWIMFKLVVAFCTLMMVLTSIEFLVDGETEKLDKSEWQIDKSWSKMWHQSIRVGDAWFFPQLKDWSGAIEETYAMTYSPIFHTSKKLSYTIQENEDTVIKHVEPRRLSVFNWFPFLQIMLCIPIVTLIFKRQAAWFNFARVGTFVIILPGILLITFLTML